MKVLKLEEVEVHSLAKALPKMTADQYEAFKADIDDNGQKVPVKVYRGKIIDGRHRYLALKDLEVRTINAEVLDSTLAIADIEALVFSLEKRRHQSPTQLAVFAWNVYKARKETDRSVSQGNVAKEFGTTRAMTARVTKLAKIAGMVVIEHLKDGGKVNISVDGKVLYTDSLLSIINFYSRDNLDRLENSTITKNILVDEEMLAIRSESESLRLQYSDTALRVLANQLYGMVSKG